MTEFLELTFVLLPALVEGAFLGVLFFAGLWWTVRKLETSKQVALLFLVSMLLRTGMVLSGFYFILGDSWQRLLAGLFGFIIVRIVVIRLTRLKDQSRSLLQKAGYES